MGIEDAKALVSVAAMLAAAYTKDSMAILIVFLISVFVIF